MLYSVQGAVHLDQPVGHGFILVCMYSVHAQVEQEHEFDEGERARVGVDRKQVELGA